jgi:enoyl-CoA hydratase/carnithine racemase
MEVLLESGVDRVALVRINRPEARNALSNAVREQLAQTFLELAGNDEVRCVILTGTENVFSAGADIKAMSDAQPFDMMLPAPERNWAPLKDFPKPLIAAVDGSALGLPFESALMMERHASQLMFATADQKEGMRAFVEKRSPNFKGL